MTWAHLVFFSHTLYQTKRKTQTNFLFSMFHEALKAPGTENTEMVSIATTVIRCPSKAGSYSRKYSNYKPSVLFHLNGGSAATYSWIKFQIQSTSHFRCWKHFPQIKKKSFMTLTKTFKSQYLSMLPLNTTTVKMRAKRDICSAVLSVGPKLKGQENCL